VTSGNDRVGWSLTYQGYSCGSATGTSSGACNRQQVKVQFISYAKAEKAAKAKGGVCF